MSDRYYPALIDLKKAGGSKFFVSNRNDIKTHIISNFEVNIFKTLSGCKTIEEHIESFIESDEYFIDESVLYEIMKKWIKNGLIRNEKLLFNHNIKDQGKNRQKVISGCITSNRPDMLYRWFGSRVNTADYIERKTPIIICDDTKIKEIQEINKRIADKYRKNYPGKIHYIDNDKKIILSERINQILPAEVPETLLDFSLSINNSYQRGKTPGTNRNALLLITAGHNLYTSDDDIEYRAFSRSPENEYYCFSDGKILLPLFYPDMNTMINKLINQEEFCLIDHFEDMIGSNISSLLNQKHSVSLENISSKTAMFQEKGILEIRTISTGYCGGRWYQNPYRPLIQQNKEREDFFHDYEKYRQIKYNGINIMSADNNTLLPGGALMGGTLCINNKKLLPPCFPQGMRDDTCFSILIDRCLEYGLNLHFPLTLYHNPREKHPFTNEDFQDISVNIGTYSILILEKLSSYFIHPKGKERFKELGFYFKILEK